LKKITNICIKLVKNYLPNSYALALILTVVVFAWGVLVTDTGVFKMVEIWNDGLYSNLPFILQMCLLMLYGQTLGIAPPVGRLIKAVAKWPKGRVQAVVLTFFIAYLATFLNWGLGLAVAAMVARDIAIYNKGSKIDFGMLVAVAYIGCQLPGMSSAIPLVVASKGHFLEEAMGTLPFSETMFAGWNIIAMIVTLAALTVTLVAMIPKPEQAVEADPSLFSDEESVSVEGTPGTVAERLEASVSLQMLLCVIGVAALIIFYRREGLGMSINTVNLTFMILGMIFHKTPRNYLKAISISIKSIAGIAFLFPLYFGMMAMMRNSGLGAIITQSIVSLSTARTLPVFTFLSAGLVNLFIPSGGGQWAVQGPVVVDAAKLLGADMGRVIMGVCWGDLWTNLIQPFWAIPVLAIAKLDVKDVMGYCTAASIAYGLSVTICMLVL
jgi:short-chain fatty acids transporter